MLLGRSIIFHFHSLDDKGGKVDDHELEDLHQLIEEMREGSTEAGLVFMEKYGPELERIAGRHLAKWLHHRESPEDVLMSVLRTFWRRFSAGEYQLADSRCIWNLLCAITLHKVRNKARNHLRACRDPGREARPSGEGGSIDAPGNVPPPDFEAIYAEEFEKLIASLNENERQIVDYKLQDMSNAEIAQKMNCSDRWIREQLKELRERIGSF